MSRPPGREAGQPLPGVDQPSPAGDAAPWARVDPGPLGLLNSVLTYLVAGRRLGPPDASFRTLEQVHEHAGRGLAAHTRSALFELEAYRLVEEAAEAGEPRWRATAAGMDALGDQPGR